MLPNVEPQLYVQYESVVYGLKFSLIFWFWTVGWSNLGCYEPLL